jgi:hypothetical protein
MNYGESAAYIDQENRKPEKKVGWFTRWFDRMSKESWERTQKINEEMIYRGKVIANNTIEPLNFDGINIKISGATGGTIIELRNYDKIKDRQNIKLYVIPTSEDFSDSFSKIVTLEMMR